MHQSQSPEITVHCT